MLRIALFIFISTFLPAGTAALAASPAQPEPVQQQAPQPAIDALFADFDHSAGPGCALGVIRNGAFIYRHGYGTANLEHGIAISSQTRFHIGSASKPFTAMAIALLAESGRISLDDSLRSYFPEFPGWAESIPLRQLVHHSSGLRDYLTLALLAGKGEDFDHYTASWVIDLLARQQETNFPSGSRHQYSSSDYLLLALLVQRVSGVSLADFSQQEIFNPLGMPGTQFQDDHTRLVPLRATHHAPADEGYRISMSSRDLVGDRGVFTSIDELLAWDSNFYVNRLGRGEGSLIELMTTPANLVDGTRTDYAFGLTIGDYRGLKAIRHDGALAGEVAAMVRFPEQRFSVAVLCNRSDAPASLLAMQVADYFLAGDMAAKPQNGQAQPALKLGPAELERYTGDFWEASEGFAAEVRVLDGSLWAVHSPQRRNELIPLGADRFQMAGTPAEVLVEYTMGPQGIVEMRRSIDRKPRGVFTPFVRRQPGSEELEAYAGVYYSAELDIRYLLSISDGLLVFSLDDEGPQELTAMFGETFENPDYGSFTFQRDAGGAITGFLLQSGPVRKLAFDRL